MDSEEEYETVRQQMQASLSQKQAVQLQFNEIKRTIEEVEKSGENDDLYELVGQVLVKKKKSEILEGLKDKKDILEFRLNSLNKSIEADTKRLQELQKTIEKT
ncbi:MAG: prefoldin subunit [Nanoarchaeota archaeon]|nr:prefoldin subunit [Nanoarchaeota archaeon]